MGVTSRDGKRRDPGAGKASAKRVQIDKTQSSMLIAAGAAAFVFVFMVIGAKSLIGQIAYQNRVITAKKTAVNTLRDNVQSSSSLTDSYKSFVTTTQNILGGNPQGTGPQDGDNAKIVLDALPSKYDYPALTASLEKLANSQNVNIESITGSDDEVAQAGQSSPKPEPVAMPFIMTVTGNYQSLRGLINAMGASIRPIQIQTLELSGDPDKMTAKIDAQTFYQPTKNFDMTEKVVK